MEQLVWCKLGYVLGLVHPENTLFDPATQLVVQEAFFERMWTISLSEMVTMIGDGEMPGTDLSEIAATLNSGVAAHSDELRSFEQSYAAEVRGIVDLAGGTATDIAMSMARDEGVTFTQPTPEEQRKSDNGFKNLFALALESDKARSALRTMHITGQSPRFPSLEQGAKVQGQ